MIALLGALREEVSGLRRQMRLVQVLAEPTYRVYRGDYRGRDILLAQTGVGRQKAEIATKRILELYPVATLVSFGFAGALDAQLRVGDVIVCSTLHCVTGPVQEATRPRSYDSDEGLLRLATQALEDSTVTYCTGNGVTAPQLIGSPERKRELGRAFQAHIVDMESYWIARIASDWRIPFIAVRAISDTQRDTLPSYDDILSPDGGLQWRKAISHFLCHPRHLTASLGMLHNVRAARGNLTSSVDLLVAKL